MTNRGYFDDLHDRVLLKVTLKWETGETRLDISRSFGIMKPDQEIVGINTRLLHCPRLNPWGEDVHIYDNDGPDAQDDGPMRLVLEMQSGDKIELVADRIEIRNVG